MYPCVPNWYATIDSVGRESVQRMSVAEKVASAKVKWNAFLLLTLPAYISLLLQTKAFAFSSSWQTNGTGHCQGHMDGVRAIRRDDEAMRRCNAPRMHPYALMAAIDIPSPPTLRHPWHVGASLSLLDCRLMALLISDRLCG